MDADRVAEAALDRFEAGGHAALSMRGLAADLGVTAPALYRVFSSKEELFGAAVDHGFERFRAALGVALAEPTPRRRLVGTFAAILDFALRRPRLYEVIAYPRDEPAVHDAVTRLHSDVHVVSRLLVDRVRECIATGCLRDDDPERLALLLWAFFHGLLVTYLSGHLELDEMAFRTLYHEGGEYIIDALSPR